MRIYTKNGGRERRHHVVYLTRNTEYHCRDRECVGVRDRGSGRWNIKHPALRGQLLGAMDPEKRYHRNPQRGQRLIFNARCSLVTSPLQVTLRPERQSIFNYTSLSCVGEIAA